MGFKKDYRPTVTTPAQTLGSTNSQIGSWPPVTVITCTATGIVYQLPKPVSGMVKHIIVDFNGAASTCAITANTTATFFNGSTHNSIRVSSSQSHANIMLVGITSAQWSANIGYENAASTGTAFPTSLPTTLM